jgi:hypothetical protein
VPALAAAECLHEKGRRDGHEAGFRGERDRIQRASAALPDATTRLILANSELNMQGRKRQTGDLDRVELETDRRMPATGAAGCGRCGQVAHQGAGRRTGT